MVPEVVITNLHQRYTGVSATVKALVPHQRQQLCLSVCDWGRLGLDGNTDLWQLLRWGWTAPPRGRWWIWHARRYTELLIGLLLRSWLSQLRKVVFTSAAPKRPGWWLRQLIRRCDVVIATSPRAAEFLDRCEVVIFHGVDCQAFQPPSDRQAALAKVGLAGHQVIANFGRIRPSKGTDLFVQALIQVLPRHPEWVGVITGLCQSRVAATRREGFGLTPLEAMASGCVPVKSSAGAWPWIIQSIPVPWLLRLSDCCPALHRWTKGPPRLVALPRRRFRSNVSPSQSMLCMQGLQAYRSFYAVKF